MRSAWTILSAMLLAASLPVAAQVEKIKEGTQGAETLPDDLFRLPPGAWAFGQQLWKGDDPCTASDCEAGYNSGDLVVSVRREKQNVRVTAGFRGCKSVAWNDYEIGDKATTSDTKTVGKRIKKTIATSAKYCKVAEQSVPELDTRRLYPIAAQQQPAAESAERLPRDPALDHRRDVVAVGLEHHRVAVAVDAVILQPQMLDGAAGLGEVIDHAVVVGGHP